MRKMCSWLFWKLSVASYPTNVSALSSCLSCFALQDLKDAAMQAGTWWSLWVQHVLHQVFHGACDDREKNLQSSEMFRMCRKGRDESFLSARLYHDGQLYIIDVSQSVENEHPQALDFLKRDCVNVASWERPDKFLMLALLRRQSNSLMTKVNNFFGKRMASRPVPVKRLFEYAISWACSSIAANLDVRNVPVKQLEMSLAACCL